jgi:Rrf2 family nitric oxide-sensitive transcriptional repressor
MHITHHTDYALRVLIYLGANEHRLATIQEISERFKISRSHLMKVVTQLIRNGYVEGLRGKGGGLRLARAPNLITIGQVVRHMENDLAIVECFEADSKCLLTHSCRLRGALGNALNAFLASLDQVTLKDLLSSQQHVLLHVPVRTIVNNSKSGK